MDTVGTFEMAEALSKKKLFTFIHKHYSVEQWMEFINRIDSSQDVRCIPLYHLCCPGDFMILPFLGAFKGSSRQY